MRTRLKLIIDKVKNWLVKGDYDLAQTKKAQVIYKLSTWEKSKMTIAYDEFSTVDLRSGTIVKAEAFPKVRKPAYKIWADFGAEIGVLQTSAQVTHHYTPETLLGRSIVGCVNLGEKNIAGFLSQFLLVGFSDHNGDICLITVDPNVPNGQKLH